MLKPDHGSLPALPARGPITLREAAPQNQEHTTAKCIYNMHTSAGQSFSWATPDIGLLIPLHDEYIVEKIFDESRTNFFLRRHHMRTRVGSVTALIFGESACTDWIRVRCHACAKRRGERYKKRVFHRHARALRYRTNLGVFMPAPSDTLVTSEEHKHQLRVGQPSHGAGSAGDTQHHTRKPQHEERSVSSKHAADGRRVARKN